MRIAYRLAAAGLAVAFIAPAAQAQWVPTQNVEMVVGSGPAGAVDTLARLLAKVIEQKKLIPTTITVLNKPGAGFSAAVAYLGQHAADGHYISLVGTGWLTTAIQTKKPEMLTSITPISKIFDTPMIFGVTEESPIKSAKDLAEAVKKNPGAVRFAISTSAGNGNHLAVLKFGEVIGIDPKLMRVIINDSGALSVTQTLGGHIEVCVCSLGILKPHIAAGKIRNLGSATEKRLADTPNVATFKEQGFDVVIAGFQMVVGPRGMTAPQLAYWEKVLKEATESKEVQDYVKSQTWTAEFTSAKDTLAFLTAERDFMTKKLNDLGLVEK